MNQEELEAFLAVIEYGSISAGAKAMHVTQPTLSARIQSLENRLGAQLVERSRGRKDTSLTVAGKNLEKYARESKRLWESAREAVKMGRQDSLTITANHTVNAYVLPEVYSRLSSEARQCSFRFLSNHYHESYRLAESGAVDVAIVSNMQYSRNVRSYPLFQDDMVLLVGENSSFPETVGPKDLNIRHEAHLDWDENFDKWYKYWFGPSSFSHVRTSDITFVRRFVQIDDNWAIVPLTVARIVCMESPIRYCTLADKPLPRTTYLLCQNDIREYPVMMEVLEKMQEIIEELGAQWIMKQED